MLLSQNYKNRLSIQRVNDSGVTPDFGIGLISTDLKRERMILQRCQPLTLTSELSACIEVAETDHMPGKARLHGATHGGLLGGEGTSCGNRGG